MILIDLPLLDCLNDFKIFISFIIIMRDFEAKFKIKELFIGFFVNLLLMTKYNSVIS